MYTIQQNKSWYFQWIFFSLLGLQNGLIYFHTSWSHSLSISFIQYFILGVFRNPLYIYIYLRILKNGHLIVLEDNSTFKTQIFQRFVTVEFIEVCVLILINFQSLSRKSIRIMYVNSKYIYLHRIWAQKCISVLYRYEYIHVL